LDFIRYFFTKPAMDGTSKVSEFGMSHTLDNEAEQPHGANPAGFCSSMARVLFMRLGSSRRVAHAERSANTCLQGSRRSMSSRPTLDLRRFGHIPARHRRGK